MISIQLLGRFWQEPEPSQATGMALAPCILGKSLGVVYHCFPLQYIYDVCIYNVYMYIYTYFRWNLYWADTHWDLHEVKVPLTTWPTVTLEPQAAHECYKLTCRV
jgi:hypothetical protein